MALFYYGTNLEEAFKIVREGRIYSPLMKDAATRFPLQMQDIAGLVDLLLRVKQTTGAEKYTSRYLKTKYDYVFLQSDEVEAANNAIKTSRISLGGVIFGFDLSSKRREAVFPLSFPASFDYFGAELKQLGVHIDLDDDLVKNLRLEFKESNPALYRYHLIKDKEGKIKVVKTFSGS